MSDEFRVTIDLGNASFADGMRDLTIAHLLHVVSANVAQGATTGIIRDPNGNTVGSFGIHAVEDPART